MNFLAPSHIKMIWYASKLTPILVLLTIWGLGGIEQKIIIKGAGFRIDKALFKVSGKNLNQSRPKI